LKKIEDLIKPNSKSFENDVEEEEEVNQEYKPQIKELKRKPEIKVKELKRKPEIINEKKKEKEWF